MPMPAIAAYREIVQYVAFILTITMVSVILMFVG